MDIQTQISPIPKHFFILLEILCIELSDFKTASIEYENRQEILQYIFQYNQCTLGIEYKNKQYTFSNNLDIQKIAFFKLCLEGKKNNFCFDDEIYSLLSNKEGEIFKRFIYLVQETYKFPDYNFDQEIIFFKTYSHILFYIFGSLLYGRNNKIGKSIESYHEICRIIPISCLLGLYARAVFFFMYYHLIGREKFIHIIKSNKSNYILHSKHIKYCFFLLAKAKKANKDNPIIDIFQGGIETHLNLDLGVSRILTKIYQIDIHSRDVPYYLISDYYLRNEDYVNAIKYIKKVYDKGTKYYFKLCAILVQENNINGLIECFREIIDQGYKILHDSNKQDLTIINIICVPTLHVDIIEQLMQIEFPQFKATVFPDYVPYTGIGFVFYK